VLAVFSGTPLVAQTNPGCDRTVYYILNGQYGRALQQLDGAKSAGGSPAEHENLRGLALMLSGDTKNALASFDASIALQPSLGEAHLNRGIALIRLGDFGGATSELEKLYADETSPLRARAAYHNALAYDGAKRTADAATWLDRALALDPSNDSALIYRGLLREKSGDVEGAAKAYLVFLKRHPDSLVAMLRMGIAAHRAGRFDVAKTYLERVSRESPDTLEGVEARKYLVMWE
jgi:tetratricopeptide (TPR) repeat protein